MSPSDQILAQTLKIICHSNKLLILWIKSYAVTIQINSPLLHGTRFFLEFYKEKFDLFCDLLTLVAIRNEMAHNWPLCNMNHIETLEALEDCSGLPGSSLNSIQDQVLNIT